MSTTFAKASEAQRAYKLVEDLQGYFVTKLNQTSKTYGSNTPFEAVSWQRDEGLHGGGTRYEARDEKLFNRGSVNISQVHYDDQPQKKLGSATALSTIIHPDNPHVPSIHMHISWTQMKEGSGYWRMMADLNPAIACSEATQKFTQTLRSVMPEAFDEAAAQGDRYFYIPALERHRGVSHFYLENYTSGDFQTDAQKAQSVGESVIDTYIEIISSALEKHPEVTQEAKDIQLAYHTLYLFQVLTLDRGTTSGLLVHDQNDVGIMGSIPKYIDKVLLASWRYRMPKPQDELLDALVDALGEGETVLVDETVKKRLAQAVRAHYTKYPQALAMQASGDTVPPTVENHTDPTPSR